MGPPNYNFKWKNTKKGSKILKHDYRTREPGSTTKMLKELELQSLSDRRKDKRLNYLYKIEQGMVPAINPNNYLTPIKTKRKINAK